MPALYLTEELEQLMASDVIEVEPLDRCHPGKYFATPFSPIGHSRELTLKYT